MHFSTSDIPACDCSRILNSAEFLLPMRLLKLSQAFKFQRSWITIKLPCKTCHCNQHYIASIMSLKLYYFYFYMSRAAHVEIGPSGGIINAGNSGEGGNRLGMTS